MKNYDRPRCGRCIYRDYCPCGYSNANAACLALYAPQTREMFLECIRECRQKTLTQEESVRYLNEIRAYMNGFSYYMSEARMRAVATEPCSGYQQDCASACLTALRVRDTSAFIHKLYDILDNQGCKRSELSYSEFVLLYSLLMAYDQPLAQKG